MWGSPSFSLLIQTSSIYSQVIDLGKLDAVFGLKSCLGPAGHYCLHNPLSGCPVCLPSLFIFKIKMNSLSCPSSQQGNLFSKNVFKMSSPNQSLISGCVETPLTLKKQSKELMSYMSYIQGAKEKDIPFLCPLDEVFLLQSSL